MRYKIKPEHVSKLTRFSKFLYIENGITYMDYATIYDMGKERFFATLRACVGDDDYLYEEPEILIQNYIPEGDNPFIIDLTLLALVQKPWIIKRGKRDFREYINEAGKLVARDSYLYTENVNSDIVSYIRKLEWFNEAGQVVIEKNKEVVEEFGSIARLNRTVRQNRIDYLMDKAVETGIKPLIQALSVIFKHYSIPMDLYIKMKDGSFADAVNAETNPTILGILAIQTDVVLDFPWTVKDAILYQILPDYIVTFVANNTAKK